nr:type VI immunity family protein [Phyllobacterium myrsinacearum]
MPVDRSSLSAFISAGWVRKHGHARLLELVRDWSSQLKPFHGICGLSVIFDIIYSSTAAKLHSFPYIKRFPGLHCGDSSMFTVEIQPHSSEYLFTTNWLTVLSADFSQKVGGKEKLVAVMGPTCPIHDYEGGIIIQAGDQAQIGDVNRGLVLDDYRRVADALKSIRFEDYQVGLFPVPEPLDAVEETMKWIGRFD